MTGAGGAGRQRAGRGRSPRSTPADQRHPHDHRPGRPGQHVQRPHRLPAPGEARLAGGDAPGVRRDRAQLRRRRLLPRAGAQHRRGADRRTGWCRTSRPSTWSSPTASATTRTGAARSSRRRGSIYRAYGDAARSRTYYPDDGALPGLPAGRSEDGLLDYGLGDWITIDQSTPVRADRHLRLLRAASAMIDIAEAARQDRRRRRGSARWPTEIGTAFGAAFLDPATGRYGNGSQACEVLALDIGVVPPETATPCSTDLRPIERRATTYGRRDRAAGGVPGAVRGRPRRRV